MRAPFLVTAAVMLVLAASRLAIIGVPSEREYDEGVYLLSARSMSAGHALFSSVFSSQPPAFLESLALALRVAGDSLTTGRLLMLGFALLAVAAMADLARRVVGGIAGRSAGRWAAPVAAAALTFGGTFGDLAHLVEAEVPALAVALVCLCSCLHARDRGWHRGWLLATGGLLALASLFKLLVAPMAAPLGLLLLLAPALPGTASWQLDGRGMDLLRRVAVRAGLVAAGALAVGSLPLLVYDPKALYDQTVAFHLAKHEVFRLDRHANLLRAARHLLSEAGITATAIAGVALLARRNRLAALWVLTWFMTALAVITEQSPLFWRHFVLLAPPLSLAAAAAVSLVVHRWSWHLALTLAAIAVCAAPSLSDPERRGLRFPWIPPSAAFERDRNSLEQAARWVSKHTAPDDLVAGDDPIVIYLAGRQAPAALCDTSQARIASRSLTLQEAVRESSAARVIVLHRGGRLSHLYGYPTWIRQNYEPQPRSATHVGPERSLWVRKGTTARVPGTRRRR